MGTRDVDFQIIYDAERTKQYLLILYQDTYDHRKAKQM